MDTITRFFSLEKRDLTLPLLVTGIGHNFIQDITDRPVGYENFQLIWTISGKGVFKNKQYEVEMNSSNLILFYKDEPHEYYPTQEPWVVNWVTFVGESIYEILSYLDIKSTTIFSSINSKAYMKSLVECVKSSSYNTKYDLCLLTMDYINTLAKSSVESNKISAIYQKLQPVLDYIDNNYGHVITLSQLSDLIDITEQHLCVLFKKAFRQRPFDYINNIRINQSKALLIEDKKRTISEIAELCGYENICYFNQVFKKKTGISPSEFRMTH